MSTAPQELPEMDGTQAVYLKLTGTSRLPAGIKIAHNDNARALVILRGTGVYVGELSGVDSEEAVLVSAQVVGFDLNPRCPSCHGVV